MARLEIVDYLRSYAGGALELVSHKCADEAAAEITRLREENARLLEDIGHYKKVIDNLSRYWLYWKDRCERFIEENARLLAANKDLQLHFDVVKEDLKKTNEENVRLREALKDVVRIAGRNTIEFDAARAAIREEGKVG